MLRRYRLAAGLSQEGLAERAGLSARAISAYERELRQAPYRETLRQLVAALHLAPPEQALLEASVDRRRTPRALPRRAASPTVHAPEDVPRRRAGFVGRNQEAADICQCFERSRLVTLVGGPGVGKTALARHMVGDLVAAYPDGSCLVQLDRLSSASFLPQAVARALHIQDEWSRPLPESVAAALRGRRLLLVLDGCDRVPEACAELAATLLAECPNLTILATSRHPLGATLERIRELTPLAPSEAAQLFVEHTRTRPGLHVTPNHSSAIERLCRRLEGNPLAIELVAARLHIMGVDETARRLDELFLLLRAGNHGLLPAPEVLRGTLDWTDALLTEQQRDLFHRVAVFAGSFELDAVNAVAGSAIRGVDGWGFLQLHAVEVSSSGTSIVLELLSRLVEASLVRVEAGAGEPRYLLLEAVRSYAATKLAESGEAPTARHRYRKWYASLVEQAEPGLTGPDQCVWLDRLERELDHIRWIIQDSTADTASLLDGFAMLAALCRLWIVRGYQGDARRLMKLLMSATEAAPQIRGSAAGMCALTTMAEVACSQGDYVTARRYAEQLVSLAATATDGFVERRAVSLLTHIRMHMGDERRPSEAFSEQLHFSRQHKDAEGTVQALRGMAVGARLEGDDEQALAAGRAWLALAGQSEDVWQAAQAATEVGISYLRAGQYGMARKRLDEALRWQREVGDRMGTARSLANLGELALTQGDLRLARERFEEALVQLREIGHRSGRAEVLASLGRLAALQRDVTAAQLRYAESLGIWRELGDWLAVATVLEALAALARGHGQDRRARRLGEAAAKLRSRTRRRASSVGRS
jgi:predicted ATPase/transcriptional regulator with XRE-family HTH domain